MTTVTKPELAEVQAAFDTIFRAADLDQNNLDGNVRWEIANDTAINLLMALYGDDAPNEEAKDWFDEPIIDQVQSLLTLAFSRDPQLCGFLNEVLRLRRS